MTKLAEIATNFFLASMILFNSFIICVSSQLFAHELSPNILDLKLENNRIKVQFTTNLEAYISGMDFSIVDNTDDYENQQLYKTNRALNNEKLSEKFLLNWNDFTTLFSFSKEDGSKLNKFVFSFLKSEVIADLSVPRLTVVHFFIENEDLSPFSVQLSRKLGDTVLRVGKTKDGSAQYLLSGEKSAIISYKGNQLASRVGVFSNYIQVGFTHIIPKGIDHILFVLGLIFFSQKIYALLFQISLFTLAHTITLGLSSLKIINLPIALVEPLIALTIVYIAIENILKSEGLKYRSMTIFIFGLLHGLGFASVLNTFGLPENHFILALTGFNLGVELGQITIVILVYLILKLLFNTKEQFRNYITIPGSLIIGVFGIWWSLERTLLT